MKVAILQSNYIPWRGVFDMINMVDMFIFFEDVDFTKRDWRSRNKIKTAQGDVWLTVPVVHSPRGTKIKDIQIVQSDWQQKHYMTIYNSYKKAPYFAEIKPLLDDFYLNHQWTNLSEMNIYMTKYICDLLKINTTFLNSADIRTFGTKDDKLIEILQSVQANAYLSGPAAKDYICNEKFKDNKIQLSYIMYDDYPAYPQMYGEYNPYVSIIDLLCNCGLEEAPSYVFKGREEIINLGC